VTPDERDVLDTIYWYTRHARRGPTFVEIRELRSRHATDVRAALESLKRQRLVSWTDEGSGTRYTESTEREKTA
jgi:hypothetical protein